MVPLLGRVLFSVPAELAAELSANFLGQRLRTAEFLSLLCWSGPTPIMPHTTEDWLVHFYQLCCTHVLPNLKALTNAWKLQTAGEVSQVEAAAASSGPRFRVRATRAGGRSTGAVTSLQIAAEAGAFFQEQCGWVVHLHDFDLEVTVASVSHWVCIAITDLWRRCLLAGMTSRW